MGQHSHVHPPAQDAPEPLEHASNDRELPAGVDPAPRADAGEIEAEGPGPERTCAVTRAKLDPDELIRFVLGPDGMIVPDLAGRLPGRGVWVALDFDTVRDAGGRNVFARSLKRSVTVPEQLAEMVAHLLVRRALDALSLANKAGLVVCGFTKTEIAIARGDAVVLVHGADAADDGRIKLERKFKALHAELETTDASHIVGHLNSEQLSLAMGRPHVVHAALTKGGATTRFIKEAGRLKRYRAKSHAGAAPPPMTGWIQNTHE